MKLTRRGLFASAAGLAAGPSILSALGKAGLAAGSLMEVRAAAGTVSGTLRFRHREYACVLGHSGIVEAKREGDGGTPAGTFPLREVRYRPDRVARPQSGLAVIATNPDDGWCDESSDPAYNRLVRMPYKADAEVMWRDDHVYDILTVIGYNDAPVVPGLGSAIFLHVARLAPDGGLLSTVGCIAMKEPDLRAVLVGCRSGIMIDIRTT